MLARALLAALVLEALAYATAIAWLHAARGWDAATLAALVVGIALGWRIVFGLATYAVAWLNRSPVPAAWRCPVPRLAAHVARELAAIISVYTLLQPFERLVMGRTDPPGPSRRLPVLLVHGYVCNRAAAWALARALRARGETVWSVAIEPIYGSIDSCVAPLAAAIDRLRGATGAARVVIVAHSMGGLAARAYLRDRGGAAVARLVTLGSPHHGSAHARLGWGENAREMTPGSAWLAALARDEAGLPVPFTSIFSYHDNFVAPQASSAHPAAHNRPLAGIGHLTLLFSRCVAQLLAEELDAANGGRPPGR